MWSFPFSNIGLLLALGLNCSQIRNVAASDSPEPVEGRLWFSTHPPTSQPPCQLVAFSYSSPNLVQRRSQWDRIEGIFYCTSCSSWSFVSLHRQIQVPRGSKLPNVSALREGTAIGPCHSSQSLPLTGRAASAQAQNAYASSCWVYEPYIIVYKGTATPKHTHFTGLHH